MNNMTLIERLTGRDNFASWKFAVKTYLEHEDLWECVSGTGEVDLKKDVKAKSKIILLIDPINYVHVQEANSAKEVWEKLCKAFDDSGLTRRVGLLRDLITTTLENCQSIEEYVNKIMTTAHKLRNIGFKVDDEWLGTLLLAGLPDEYKPMIMAIESSGVAITADSIKSKLLQEVKNRDPGVFFVNKSKNNKQPIKQKSKGPRCYTCNKYGHIGKNCKVKNNKKQSDNSFVAVFSATSSYDFGWYVDSGAAMHMTMNRAWIYDEKPPPIKTIRVANNKELRVESCGKVNIHVKSTNGSTNRIQVTNVLYVPELSTNLLSVSNIVNNKCNVKFDCKGCYLYNKDNVEVAMATLVNNMYKLNVVSVQAFLSTTNDDFYLWHQRLAHLNYNDMKKLKDHTEGVKIPQTSELTCIPCIKGKQARSPFPSEGSRASQLLEIIHSDICGPMEVNSLGNARYFLTFTDDFSRKVCVFTIKSKSECLDKFKEYKSYVENRLNTKIKTLRTDNGTEYTSKNFTDYLKLHGIKHQTSIPYTPQQNGLSERMNRTLLEKARCMLINANLQKNLWAEAVRTAAYIINRSPTRALNYKTPEEVWSGCKPDLSHMRIFGCQAMVQIPQEKLKKWDAKSSKMIFVGYCEDSKGYRLLDPKTKIVTKSRDVVFLENSIKPDTVPVTLSDAERQEHVSSKRLSESSDCSTDLSTHTAVEMSENDDDEEYVPEQSIEVQQPSTMTLRPRNRPIPTMEPKSYICMADVPQTYEEALSSEDSEMWIKSIKEELQAHEDNGTWEIVKKPDNARLLDCKWVFRVKSEPTGPRYKARLCAKGFAQKSGIDYTETFSPTVRYDSIRLLLSIAAEKCMTLKQFDIKTAFLYGELQEKIYMKIPEGLNVENGMACKLIKSLYGLKQAPRCWNAKFNSVLIKYGFVNCHADKCVYVSSNREALVYLLLYVDDGLLCSTNPTIITEVLNDLQKEFNVKICEALNFIGIQIEQCKDYIFIHQRKYIEKMLSKFNLDNANPNSIPADPHVTLQKSTVLEDKKYFPYREAVGSLMFAAIVTRPDIMYAVSTVSRYLNSHDQSHWNAVKRILKYLKGTLCFGLCYRSNESNTLVSYSDADYANDPVTRRSTTGYVFMKNGAAVTWNSQLQTTVALSTTEAEFMASCCATKEALWVRQLLLDIGHYNQDCITLNIDNQSAICVIKNSEYHKRCKHIDVKYNFVKEKYTEKIIDLKYISTDKQLADIFTKPLSKVKFEYFRNKLGLIENPKECKT